VHRRSAAGPRKTPAEQFAQLAQACTEFGIETPDWYGEEGGAVELLETHVGGAATPESVYAARQLAEHIDAVASSVSNSAIRRLAAVSSPFSALLGLGTNLPINADLPPPGRSIAR
jgi:hypothetical protein